MHTVAYLGPEKTNTHLAALARFGRNSRYLHAPTVEDVFRLVEREEAGFGVVPIENSLEGVVTYTLDRFIDFKKSPAKIYGEIEQPIQHCLIIRKKTHPDNIKVIYSHPQAFAQCRVWLEHNHPRAARRERNSTADAVRDLFDEKEKFWDLDERAAIGRRELADGRRLRAISIPIEKENRTRFLVIALRNPPRFRSSKTSLMFTLKDAPGALHDALVPFKKEGINLTKIESRPSKRKAWEYVFFIDLEGHESEPRVQRALKALSRTTTEWKVLGSYPVQR